MKKKVGFLVVYLLILKVSILFSQDITSDTTLANLYLKKSDSLLQKYKLDSSLFYIKEAQAIFISDLGENSLKNAKCNLLQGNIFYYIFQLDSAITYYQKSVSIILKINGENDIIVANCYNNLGAVYMYKSEFSLSLDYFQKSLLIRTQLFGENSSTVAESYNNMGIIYVCKSDYIGALKYYQKGLNLKLNLFGEKNKNVADCYYNIGNVFSDNLQYNKALEYYQKSLSIRTELLGNESIEVADCYCNIGNIFGNESNYSKAIEYYQNALSLFLKLIGEKNSKVAILYNNISTIYRDEGNYDEALAFLNKSLSISNEIFGEKNINIAVNYFQMALVYNKKEEFQVAENYFNKSILLYKELLGLKSKDIANCYNFLGELYEKELDYDSALINFQKGLYSISNDYADSTDYFEVPKIGNYFNSQIFLTSLYSEANIFADTLKKISKISNEKRLLLALKYFKACDTVIIQTRKEFSVFSDLLLLNKQASIIYKGSIDLCESLKGLSESIEDKINYDNLAFYFSESNKSSSLLQSMVSSNALKFSRIPDSLIQKEHNLKNDITNFSNLRDNAENDSMTNVWGNKLFNVNQSYDSLISYFEANYPKYYQLKYNTKNVTPQQISKQINQKTALLSYSITDSNIFIFYISKKDFRVFKTKLPDSLDIKIDYYRQSISDKDLIQKERTNNTNKSLIYFVKNSNIFYNLLFPPEIQKLLNNNRIKSLVIVPDGDLARLPFETLLTEKYDSVKWLGWTNRQYFAEMPYLIKKYNISYNYSATLYSQMKNTVNNKKIKAKYDWIGFAPVFDDENIAGLSYYSQRFLKSENQSDSTYQRAFFRGGYINSLPGTKEEVQDIFKLFNLHNKSAKINLYTSADEQAIKSQNMADYKIIHLATHGYVDEINPDLSAILLAQDTMQMTDTLNMLLGNVTQQDDGFLYESEIYNLNLNADLVVLSACETGLGQIADGEGVIGLSRALIYAGADNLIVSLWQVSDKATQILMVEFYKNLLHQQNQKQFSESLRKAKLEMIKQGLIPYFWSPFILIGE